MRIRSLCVMLLAGLVVAGCDSDCPTPTAPSSPSPGLGVASLTISGPEQLEVGQTAQLTATARLSDGTSQDVTTATAWVTNNVNICTVNAAGVLTAVSAGVCNVNGVFQNITGTIVITCFTPGEPLAHPPSGPPTGPPTDPGPPPPGPSVGLRLDGPSSVTVGQQIQLRAFRTDNNQEVTDQASWSGNNNGVAGVGSQGRVTGVGAGAMIVQAVFQGAGANKTITVIGIDPPPPVCPGPNCPPPPVCQNPPCNPPPPNATQTGLAIQGVTSVNVGQTSQLQAIASYSDGTTQNVTGQSQWSSGDAGIASVNGSGLVTGVAVGQTPVSAAFGGQTATVAFTVSGGGPPPPPTANSLTVTGTSPLTVGQTSQYNAIANMSDGTTQNVNGTAQWSSSNPGVATVGSTGIVTAVAAGQTMITATFQSRSGSVPLTVNAAQPDLIGLELNINGNILAGNGPLGLNLNLSDLINGNPILSLKVFGLYSDGSKRDVTSLAVINSPLIAIDGQGTAQVLLLLLQGLLLPNHPINVTYGGFTAIVNVQLQLPVLQSIGFNSGTVSLNLGTQLPALTALLSQGLSVVVNANGPGVTHSIQPAGVLATALNIPIVGALAKPLVDAVLNTLSIVDGRLVSNNQGLVTSLLSNPLFTALGLGNILPVQVRATLNGVTSAPILVSIIG